MKIRQRFLALLTAAFILSGSFPVFAAKAEQMPEETITQRNSADVHDEKITDDASLSKITTVSGNKAEFTAKSSAEDSPEETALTENTIEPENGTGFPVPDEAPAFHARIEFRMGYTVIGTFTDFTPDIVLIQTLYSLDGENWQTGAADWNLSNLGTDDEDKLNTLQNQPCLFDAYEPLKSYIAGKTDRFYLKLCITKKNGLSYETQSAVIERGGLQPIPEGTECSAWFSSAIAVREPDPAVPYRYRKYGRYQLTVCADATAEDVSALLPDTLPVEIQLNHGQNFIAIGIVDCPVTWKPLSLPRLSSGESIMIPDAAEEILVPAGTRISTPLGIFQLDEPLSLNTLSSTDEVMLVLNVSPEDRNPTGVLRAGKNGLEMAFHRKPTGAASIRAYALAEGESAWTELSGLSLPEDLNQPSTANSGYALILRNDQEPYRSYLAAMDAGETPAPFFIGLKIEGGIYDGRQLILAWPDTYEQLPDLPQVGGAGGNEGNAGADNKEDSTENGQRPNLPQMPDENQEEQQSATASDPNNNPEEQLSATASNPNDSHEEQQPATASNPNDNPEEQQKFSASDDNGQNQQTFPAYTPETASAIPGVQSASSADESFSGYQPEHQGNQFIPGQRSGLPQTIPDTADTSAANQEDGLTSAPLIAKASADTKEAASVPALSDTKTAIEHAAKNNSRIPILPVTAAVAAGGCIGTAVSRTAGHNLLHRIAAKIRNIFNK